MLIVGIAQELTINVKSLCQCPCETPGNQGFELNSPMCKNHGNLTCGICQCDEGYTGKQCECDESNLYGNGNLDDPNANCKDETSDNADLICNGRGQCNCGVCICDIDSRGAITGKNKVQKSCENETVE